LLTGTETFERHQPLFWMVGANMLLRMGDHTLLAFGTAKSPIDFKTAEQLKKRIKEVLGDDFEKELGGMDFRSRLFSGRFENPEANQLKDQHRELYYFNEAWIPELKKGGIGRVQLYDLSMDLRQQNDIANENPEIVARMKEKAAAIYASVMADAPEWPEPDAPIRSGTRQEFRQSRSSLRDETAMIHGSDRGATLGPTVSNEPTSQTNEQKVLATSATEKTRPNVVVLYVDDLGWQDIGCYGGPVRTPTLDKLAAKGVRLTDFHSGCAVCSPSRATVMTGRHHIRSGVYHVISDRDHAMHLLESEVTIAEVLKENGYDTVHLGKWHMGLPLGDRKKPTPYDHGFDYWFGTENTAHPSHKDPVNFHRHGKPLGRIEGYACQIVVDEAISWLEKERQADTPFFLNIWFHEPHAPIAAPDEIVTQYGDLDDPAAIYSGTIENTDRAIGRLFEKLNTIDEFENTIIVYASDNGSYRTERNGPLKQSKGSNFEGGIRVPGIICWLDGISTGQVEKEPAGMVDLLPTICGLTGIDKPEGVHLDGSDLSPLLTGRRSEFQRHIPLFFLLPTSNPMATVRDGRFALVGYRDYELPKDLKAMNGLMDQVEVILKLENSAELRDGGRLWSKMFNTKFANKEAEKLRVDFLKLNRFQESWIPTIKTGGYKRFELYDLDADIGQKADVAKQHPAIANRLKQQLLDITASVMSDGPDWNQE
ncbi:MAG: sulfatase-like hydrolase/transferase, partial [Planctomycetota bacterium]